jgi:hypothetical protein
MKHHKKEQQLYFRFFINYKDEIQNNNDLSTYKWEIEHYYKEDIAEYCLNSVNDFMREQLKNEYTEKTIGHQYIHSYGNGGFIEENQYIYDVQFVLDIEEYIKNKMSKYKDNYYCKHMYSPSDNEYFDKISESLYNEIETKIKSFDKTKQELNENGNKYIGQYLVIDRIVDITKTRRFIL